MPRHVKPGAACLRAGAFFRAVVVWAFKGTRPRLVFSGLTGRAGGFTGDLASSTVAWTQFQQGA